MRVAWFTKKDKGFADINHGVTVVAQGSAHCSHRQQTILPTVPPNTMGGCISTVDRVGKERSAAIDKMIEEDQKRFKRECKILLLGTALY